MIPDSVWGLAGPSACGKSTLAFALQDYWGEELSILHLDDYYHPPEKVPTIKGYSNWDHPDALRWDDFLHDIKRLRSGEAVEVETKSLRYNPAYPETQKKVAHIVRPRPILLLEGYLLLYNEAVRRHIDTALFLNLDGETRLARRKVRRQDANDEGYAEEVVEPMGRLYVEPTALYAAHVVEVGGKGREEVFEEALGLLVAGRRKEAQAA